MTLSFFGKAILAVALLIVFVLSSAVAVCTKVTVRGVTIVQGTVTYSLDNAESGVWTTTLSPSSPSDHWYSRLEINGAGDNEGVTITWKLQQETGFSSWTDVSGAAMSTSIVLSGNMKNIYATIDGAYSSGNYEWGQNITASGTYRVVVTIMAYD